LLSWEDPYACCGEEDPSTVETSTNLTFAPSIWLLTFLPSMMNDSLGAGSAPLEMQVKLRVSPGVAYLKRK
jgi:hypothetical protein